MNRTEKKITKRYLFVLLVILLAVMTACGGEDDTVGTEAATPFPTEPTPEPAEESTVVEEPTPTIAPTPTVAPSPTPEPTEEPAGDGWGTSGGTAQSACDHPYFPMRVGSTWTYSDGTNTLIWEVTDIQGDLNQASASLQATINSVTIDYAWDCDASQGMASFDFASLGVAPAGVEMTIESQSLEGVFLLPADQLQPGANWPLTLVGTFSFNQTAGGTQIEATGDLTSEQVYTVTGVEPVTFDEQMVDGLQVEQTNTVTMNINILGTSTNQVLNIGGSYEFDRGIGMIRQVFTSDFGPESFELVSYQVP